MAQMSGSSKTLGSVSFLVLGLSLGTIGLSGCDLTRNHLKMDRSGHMEMQDYRDAMASRVAEEDAIADAAAHDDSIPAMEPYVAMPSEKLQAMPLVSISINQTVPLRDALFELASQASYDIELDPRIKGSIIFTARDKPFDLVIRRISEIAGLRYKFEDGIVRVEVDTPYHKTYKIDYLSYVRSNTSSIKNDVSVVSGGGANTGSKFEAASKSEADFWGELNTNITQILGVPMAASSLTTPNDPTITAAPANPVPVEPVVATTGEAGQPVVQVAPPAATLQVQSLPTDQTQQQASAPVQAGQSPDGSSFSINKQAGIISINATERQHEQIGAYLDELRRSVTAQVLIEAKILEVSLSDEFSAGINWEMLENMIGEFSLGFDATGSGGRPLLNSETVQGANFSIGYAGNDVNAVIDAISSFGTVKALASPRLTVLNNQSAVLNVANNSVYFEIDIDITTADNTTQTNVDSEIKNVPEGVLINVQPSINLDDRSVSMAVRPTVTRIVDTVSDPAIAFVADGLDDPISSDIPIVNIQEMDSVVKMNSGQALLMGGLMQDRTDSSQQGVPVLSEIPLVGAAFRNQVDKVSKTELIVFLKATIVDADNNVIDKADKDLYKRFSGDRRPLRL
ncbi:MAG: type II and III secretion system family protein [Micavibrio aeruginosavorus]|nr:type II and III secretion system family protein [Micavibrio aeruginosavorus]